MLYMYDIKTGELTGSRPAQVVGGREITRSASATTVAPPEDIPVGSIPRWTGVAWEIIEDHRQHMDGTGTKQGGTQYWLPGDTYTTPARYMEELGPLPDGATLEPPAKTQAELDAERRAEIISRLSAIDTESVRPLRAIADGTATDFDRQKLAAAEAEAAELRAELASIPKAPAQTE
jgi:hypothetical protein